MNGYFRMFVFGFVLLIFQGINAQRTESLWSSNDGTIDIKVKFKGVDPGGAEHYYFIVTNNSPNSMRVFFKYEFGLKSTTCSSENGTYSKEISKNKTDTDGEYSGSISNAKECSNGTSSSVETWSISDVRITNLDLDRIDDFIKEANAHIELRNFDTAEDYINKASNLCDNCERDSKITNSIENLKQEKLKVQQEEEENEQKEKEEEQKEKVEGIGVEGEAVKEESQEAKRKTEADKEREYNLYLMCIGKKTDIEKLIQKARQNRTADSWIAAQNAYQDFYNDYCKSKVGLPLEWKEEIDTNVMSFVASEAVVGTAEMLATSPWTYGYGEFIDAKNKTYVHRFQLGMSGTYITDQVVNVDLSLMVNIMRIPSRTAKYIFEADDSNLNFSNVEKFKEFNKINVFSLSIGPSINIWPQKNIFINLIPEINLGMQSSDDAPVKPFTIFPTVISRVGFRLGKVYLSGTYGLMYKKLQVDQYSDFVKEKGTINAYNHGTVQGNWIANSFDNDKFLKHSYWLISLGLDL